MSQLTQLEQRLAGLIEGGFARLFSGCVQPSEVAAQLAHVMDESAERSLSGEIIAPNVYQVHLHPTDFRTVLSAQPDLIQQLGEGIVNLAKRATLRLRSTPLVHLISDENLNPHEIQVRAYHEQGRAGATQQLPMITPPAAEKPQTRPAYLILQGRYLPLDRAVTTIGRRRDNNIVLEDARVSRTHAQVRARFGRYVVFDLGSSSGTFVNGHRISEHILKPGDVITCAAVNLVYVEDESATHDPHKDTQIGGLDTEKKVNTTTARDGS